MLKLIFLDIDGVLNSYETGDAVKLDRYGWVNKSRVETLNRLTDNTGAKLVISSTWRKPHSDDYDIVWALKELGVTGEIIGCTPSFSHNPYLLRGNEILAWMKQNEELLGCMYCNFHSYVILDDDSDMLYWQRNNLFLLDVSVGLTPTIAYRIERFFASVTNIPDNLHYLSHE